MRPITLEDVPEHLRDEYAQLPPQMLAFALEALGGVYAEIDEKDASAKIELPAPPVADEFAMVSALLYRRRNPEVPLTESQRREVDAVLGRLRGDRSLDPRSYNQPVRMLTLTEAAEMLDLSTSTVDRLTRGRGLPALRFFKTVRLRSDHVWAVGNRIAAGHALGDGADLLVSRSGATDRGVPIADVAATLRVHPQTLWRWWRRYAAAASPHQPVTSLAWRCAGRRADAVIPEDVLTGWNIPYDPSTLRVVGLADLELLTARERRAIEQATRHLGGGIPPDKVRRDDNVVDAESWCRLYTLAECAEFLGMTPSGARKAISRAGIATDLLGGVSRVRQDDLMQLLFLRACKRDRRLRPDFTPDTGGHHDLIPLPEAALQMKVTVRTLRRRGAAGKIDLVTSGGELFVRRHQVLEGAAAAGNRDTEREQARHEREAASNRGAVLTEAHIDVFRQWLQWRHPDTDPATCLFDRAGAARRAGCRPADIDNLVSQGLIPARRVGQDLQIRLVDLAAAGVYSAKVARMCPKLRVTDVAARRNIESEFLTFDEASRFLDRTPGEVRYLVTLGVLNAVRFGGAAHRLHESEVTGPGQARVRELARPYTMPKRVRHLGWSWTVNDAAHHLGVCERTVLKMVSSGELTAMAATRKRWRRGDTGNLRKVPVAVNNGGLLLHERSVRTARQLRQVRGLLPRDDVPVTPGQLEGGTAKPLQPWQRYRLFDESGCELDEYGQRI